MLYLIYSQGHSPFTYDKFKPVFTFLEIRSDSVPEAKFVLSTIVVYHTNLHGLY